MKASATRSRRPRPKRAAPPGAAPRRVTVQVPGDLLSRAQARTGGSVAETIRQGLEQLARTDVYQELLALKGKIRFSKSWEELKDDRP